MPTYEYACRDCGHQFETVQSFTDDALTDCPRCDGSLRKVFSAAGIIFKGSGYYVTDSRSGGPGSGSNGAAKNGQGDDATSGAAKDGTASGNGAKGADGGKTAEKAPAATSS